VPAGRAQQHPAHRQSWATRAPPGRSVGTQTRHGMQQPSGRAAHGRPGAEQGRDASALEVRFQFRNKGRTQAQPSAPEAHGTPTEGEARQHGLGPHNEAARLEFGERSTGHRSGPDWRARLPITPAANAARVNQPAVLHPSQAGRCGGCQSPPATELARGRLGSSSRVSASDWPDQFVRGHERQS